MAEPHVLRRARLPDGRLVAVELRDGRIASIQEEPVSEATGRGATDLNGMLLLPAFVDGHTHLDKTLVGAPWYSGRSPGSVPERIERERRLRPTIAVPTIERASALVAMMVASGTGLIRSHVDIDSEIGLAGLLDLLEVRARFVGVVEIELVAFPQSGIVRSVGIARLLDEAISLGADIVGGLDPAGIDGDIVEHLDTVFGIATRHGCPIDIHLHDQGALGWRQVREIARRTVANGMQGTVTISHAYCLATAPERELLDLADTLAGAGVSIATSGPPYGTPPIRRLTEAGVVVFGGSDNIRDAWSPFGDGDMLRRASIIAINGGLVSDDDLRLALDLVTTALRTAAGGELVSLHVGSPADLVAVEATSAAEAVAVIPPRRVVWHHGVEVSRRQVQAETPSNVQEGRTTRFATGPGIDSSSQSPSPIH